MRDERTGKASRFSYALILGSLPSARFLLLLQRLPEDRLTLLSHLTRIFLALVCPPFIRGGRGEK